LSGGASSRAPRGLVRRGLAAGMFAATFMAFVGCGQRGPLTLPDSARPIERLPPSSEVPEPDARPDAPSPAATPAPPGARGESAPAQREPDEPRADQTNNGKRE
jgi:predicted small lipoprotein YifL